MTPHKDVVAFGRRQKLSFCSRCSGSLPRSIQRRICFSINGPMPCSSVNGLFCATRSVAFSGHRKALRAARRKARESISVSSSARRASSSAISQFDSTTKNRFRFRLHGDQTIWPDCCAHCFFLCDFNNDG